MSANPQSRRVLSGMRPTGQLHLGNFHGALRNWVELQYQYECFFFVADWHALTTHYDEVHVIGQNTREPHATARACRAPSVFMINHPAPSMA